MTSSPHNGSAGCPVAVLVPLAIALTLGCNAFLTHDKLKQVTHFLDHSIAQRPTSLKTSLTHLIRTVNVRHNGENRWNH
ncbi:hypothetical protein H6F86_14805 [Phormidium sp. FACHB-592]|uniref:H repeat-associated protein N-terminal domain-containing protein n=1 Tax=Stenomitos frigidus AS-A4 TaxID=2933935 RepID=A0ABV0KPA6_9CYAN|nr:hypothetical protein [Phormidium sp. FACHB-592]MBD2075141.1 hypothetical protein [Phormidium sp. FACHB-592]